MTLSEQVGSITRSHYIPTLYDTVTIKSALTAKVLTSAQEWTSGKDIQVPVKIAKSTIGGLFGIGTRLPTERQNNRKLMEFELKGIEKPVVIDKIEKFLNKGVEQVLDAVSTEIDSMGADLMDDFADQVYSGAGSGLEFNSLDNAADDGTNYGTYGDLSRTSYESLEGYYLAAAGALTLGKMATAFDSTERGDAGPTEMFTTKALWSAYEDLNTPTVNANYTTSGAQKISFGGNLGFQYLSFRGVPVLKDEACPSGRMYLVNTQTNGKLANFGAVMADLSSVGSEFSTVNFTNTDGAPEGTFGSRKAPRGFNFRDMMSPVDMLSEVGYLIFSGNVIAAQPNLQGQMRGLTA